MTRDLFYPFIDIFMLALPHTYRAVTAENGATIKLTVPGEIGGSWFLRRSHGAWELGQPSAENPSTEVTIEPSIAWKLFSKSLRPDQVINNITITGNQELGEVALTMVSVIA